MLLDQLRPDWRDSFPIPLDVDTVRDFVNSLLQSASRDINDSQRRQILDCKHYFTAGRPDQLLTEVSFPNEIAITLLEEVESSRLEVAIHEGTKLARDLGPYYAERTEHGFKIKNLPANNIVIRHTPTLRVRLVFSIFVNKLTQLEIATYFF